MKYILAFTVALLLAFPVKADDGFKKGQMFGQKFFCFYEPVIMEYAEHAAEDLKSAIAFFQISARTGQCGVLSETVPVIVKNVIMDYVDSDGDKMQVIEVVLPKPLKHIQGEKQLFTIALEKLSKDAKMAPSHGNI